MEGYLPLGAGDTTAARHLCGMMCGGLLLCRVMISYYRLVPGGDSFEAVRDAAQCFESD